MTVKINGTASATQVLTGDMQYYRCIASSPFAFSKPDPNPMICEEIERGVNILVTNNGKDQSQKNFEILLMSIAMRAMPVILANPQRIEEIACYSKELSGEGFVWTFAVERESQFFNYSPYGTPGPVGLLIDEIDGVLLPSGVRLTTKTSRDHKFPVNITFQRVELCDMM